MKTLEQKKHQRFIGIKQAQRTIWNINRRKKLGIERPGDQALLTTTKAVLLKWETTRVA